MCRAASPSSFMHSCRWCSLDGIEMIECLRGEAKLVTLYKSVGEYFGGSMQVYVTMSSREIGEARFTTGTKTFQACRSRHHHENLNTATIES